MTVQTSNNETVDMQPIHGEKLKALINNPKLPKEDLHGVEEALVRYKQWHDEIDNSNKTGDDLLQELVESTNRYKFFIEYDLIFCSNNDFLYRSKGQTKIDNTILEEFLPKLVDKRLVPGISNLSGLTVGPQKSFAGLSFGFFNIPLNNGGMNFKEKDQDFTVGRKLYIKASQNSSFAGSDDLNKTINIAYFVSELKTNLDKTMFQEAAATSKELKTNVTGSKYLLLCEWLDMPPIDTRQTHIDEAIVLRKAKRLSSNQRSEFSSYTGRMKNRVFFEKFLKDNPLHIDSFRRIVKHLNETFPESFELNENEVLSKGYF